MTVRWCALADVDATAWDALLAASDAATPFHTLGWAHAVATLPSTVVRVALCEGDAGYRGAALVAERRAGPVVKRSAGVYGAYGQPLVARDAPDADALHAALVDAMCGGLGAAGSLELADFGGRVRLERDAVQCAARTRVLDVSAGYVAVQAAFEVTVRQKLRQAARAGVTIDASGDEAARTAFRALAAQTYARHDSAPPPAVFYDAVLAAMLPRGEARLALARTAGGAVAGAALHLLGGAHVFNWLTALDPAHATARPSNVLVDDALRWAVARGARLYNFGATPEGSGGVEAFKKAWGSVPYDYPVWRVQSAGYRLLRALRGGAH